jgi:hypothetical protein
MFRFLVSLGILVLELFFADDRDTGCDFGPVMQKNVARLFWGLATDYTD